MFKTPSHNLLEKSLDDAVFVESRMNVKRRQNYSRSYIAKTVRHVPSVSISWTLSCSWTNTDIFKDIQICIEYVYTPMNGT